MRFGAWAPHYHWMRCRRMDRVARVVVKRMASLLFCQPRRHITVAPALLLAAIPSGRTAVFVSLEDIAPVLAVPVATVVTIMVPHAIAITLLDLVSNFVGVVFGPLRQRRTSSRCQTHQHDDSNPKGFGHKYPLRYLVHFDVPAGKDK
jgi:hypothetical protein